MANSRKPRTAAVPGSFLSPEAMGGIIAGKGLDFQTRYAVCHLPVWLGHGAFHQLYFEGHGDVDIRFVEDGKSSRVNVQVKDHDVPPAELKTVLAHFRKLDEAQQLLSATLKLLAKLIVN